MAVDIGLQRFKRVSAFGALSSILVLSTPASADNYNVTLTRKDSNLYEVVGKNVVVQTRYCYAYVYSEDSLLRTSGYGGEVLFLDSNDKCDVKAIYGSAPQGAGDYRVTVSRDDDNWYAVSGTNLYLKTSLCLSLALSEDAVLTLNPYGSGEVTFEDGDRCSVDGVYEKMRL